MKKVSCSFVRKKRLLAISSVSLAVLAIGATIAYNQDSMFFANLFHLGNDVTEFTETFTSPDNWVPCQEVDKEAIATNKNSSPRYARMKINEYWREKNSQTDPDDHEMTDLPLTWTDNGTKKHYAIINTQNDDEWELKDDGWYYYKTPLQQNESTLSLLKSVTFNCEVNTAGEIRYSANGQSGESIPTDYADAQYHLYITFQMSSESFVSEDPDCEGDDCLNTVIAKKSNVLDDFEIKFQKKAIISDDRDTVNGNGVNPYTEKGQTIYYYRGEIHDNYLIWADMCWRIMRTTYTGGTKLIYAGIPKEVEVDGRLTEQCYDNTVLYEKAINYNASNPTSSAVTYSVDGKTNSLAYMGYMYGESLPFYQLRIGVDVVFGNDVKHNTGGGYTLKDTYVTQDLHQDRSIIDGGYHYTCGTTSDTCDEVYYVYVINQTGYNVVALKLTDEDDFQGVLDKMFANEHDSKVKQTVDNWYESEIYNKGFDKDVEDAIYCNDRSFIGGLNSKDESTYPQVLPNMFSATTSAINNYRIVNNNLHPSLDCPNRRDAFTKDDTMNGNGALKYKVGLLTTDELTLAAAGTRGWDNSVYVHGARSWTMTPTTINSGEAGMNTWLNQASGSYGLDYPINVRPAVSLKKSKKIVGGSGTVADPYRVSK